MEFSHSGDDSLTGFFIGVSLESRVFFRQLRESDTHFFLSGLCLRLDGDFNYRIREFHGFQNNLMLFITQGISCRCIFQTNCSRDISGVNFGNFFSFVSVHLQDSSDSLLLSLCGVVHIGTGVQGSGVYAEESQLTYKRVCHDFKRQSGEWSLVIRGTFFFLFRTRNNTLNRWNIQRRRHIVNNCVQHHLNTLVSVSGTGMLPESFRLPAYIYGSRL